MTDPRFGAALLIAIKQLPKGAGVIFRHYELEAPDRLALFRLVRRLCRQRGHMLLLAGAERTALRWHADGFHARGKRRQSNRMIHSAPVHDRRELMEERRNSVDLTLISPMFTTVSHAGAQPLGRTGYMALARQCADIKVIALGGMSARKATTLDRRIIYGWAAIDAFRH